MHLQLPRLGKYFYRIMVLFVGLSLIITIALSIVFFRYYERSVESELGQLSVDMLAKSSYHTEFIMKLAIAFAVDAYNDLTVTTWLNLKAEDQIAEYNAVRSLIARKSSYPYIHSVFVYNRALGRLAGTGGVSVTSLASFDPQLESSLNAKLDNKIVVVPRKLSLSATGETENILSLVLPGQTLPDGHVMNAIIVNVYSSSLLEQVKQSAIEKESTFFILDRQGTVIAHENKDEFMKSYADKNYVQRIFASSPGDHLLKAELDGAPYTVSFQRNDAFGWTFVYFVPARVILESVRKLLTSILVICGLFLLLAFTLSGAFSGLAYRPIRKLLGIVEGGEPPADYQKKLNEIEYVSTVYRELNQRARQLYTQNQSNRMLLAEELLRNILLGEIDPKEAAERLIECKTSLGSGDYRVVLTKVERRAMLRDALSPALDMGIRGLLSEALASALRFEAVIVRPGEIAVIVSPAGIRADIVGIFTKAREKVEQTFSPGLSVGIGDPAGSVGGLSSSFESARELLRYRMMCDCPGVFDTAWVEEHTTEAIVYPEGIEKEIVESIRLNRREAFLNELDELLKLSDHCRYRRFLFMLMQIAFVCVTQMAKVHAERSMVKYFDYRAIGLAFDSMESLAEVKAWFSTLFEDYRRVLDEVETARRDKTRELVRKAISRIEECFTDANLSGYLLASEIGLSPNYFSRVFKEITRTNVSDFIAELRFAKARELLHQTDLNVQDIAVQSGFPNVNYFYYSFKKHTGLTPASYRVAAKGGSQERARGA